MLRIQVVGGDTVGKHAQLEPVTPDQVADENHADGSVIHGRDDSIQDGTDTDTDRDTVGGTIHSGQQVIQAQSPGLATSYTYTYAYTSRARTKRHTGSSSSSKRRNEARRNGIMIVQGGSGKGQEIMETGGSWPFIPCRKPS